MFNVHIFALHITYAMCKNIKHTSTQQFCKLQLLITLGCTIVGELQVQQCSAVVELYMYN